MPNYDEILAQSDRNVTDLKNQLQQFEQLHKDLQRRIEQAEKVPFEYQRHFTNIKRISERFVNDLGGTVQKYFDGNNSLFNKNLTNLHSDVQRLDKQIETFKKEISRLKNTNLEEHFERHQQKLENIVRLSNAIDSSIKKNTQTLTNLENAINRYDANINKITQDINKKIAKQNDFLQILSNDFEKYQKTLSDIFQAINQINLQIGTVTNSLNRLEDSINNAKKAIIKRLDEQDDNIKQHFENTKEDIFEKLDKQEILIQQLNGEIAKANELLSDNQKQISINRVINVVSFVVIVVLLIFLIIKVTT